MFPTLFDYIFPVPEVQHNINTLESAQRKLIKSLKNLHKIYSSFSIPKIINQEKEERAEIYNYY